MNYISTPHAPAAIGPYSQAAVVGNIVYTSGQIALVPDSMTIIDGGIKEQTAQVIANLKAVLEAAGSNLSNVIKTTCFLTDMADFAAFNEVYTALFPGKPARSCVAVKALPMGVNVEIEAIAVIKEG